MTRASPLTARRDRRRPQAVPGRLAAARPRLSRPGDPRVRAERVVPARLDRRRARGGRRGRPGRTSWPTVDDEPLIVVRGRDDVLRGFYNVCRHRGTAVVEEPCGKAVRFQCPYHAWIYDLDGSLIRAKHTDDLDDFSFDDVRAGRRSGSRPGRASSSSASTRTRTPLEEWLGDLVPASRPVRLRGAARRPHGDLRGRRQLEVHRRELQRVLPLPGHPPAAQQADAVRPRRRLRARRAVAGRLDGARRRRRDDGARRRPSRRPAGDGRASPRSTTGGSTTTWSGRRRSCRSTRTTCSSTGSSRPAPGTPGSSATGCSSRRRSPRPASTRPTRSPSGT